MGSGSALYLMSSISMDSIVYCRKFWGRAAFLGGRESRWRSFVIPFIERTWFLCWMIAVLLLWRWVRLFSTRTDDAALEMPNLKRSAGFRAGEQIFRSAEPVSQR